MSKQYERHPLSAAWGDMSPEEWEGFEASILAEGVKEPIVIFQGKVLDGWHRHRAATNNGLSWKEIPFMGSVEEAKALVKRKHNRRNLNASQRALAITRVNEWAAPGRNPEPGSGLTEGEMAREADVSDRTIRDAKKVVRRAVPQVLDAVAGGDLSLKAAAHVAELPAAKQEKELKKVLAGEKPKRPPPRPTTWTAPPEVKPQLGATKEAYDELLLTCQELQRDLQQAQDRIAIVAMGGATDEERDEAERTLKELRQQVQALEVENGALKGSRDHLMEENAELKRTIAALNKRLAKPRPAERATTN